ncbi:DUF3883 domain-containing protein [Flavobacterium sp. IMCC34852]|uniref:DUF3883 domain-containing protein n=1 Tax=Flavobacterium rivulicola TaxID=2732161 RepID=A0A7Y3VXR4_9FLAO|nr:DUF3883 domain-containing protein [Flavobacterium sp. IMCC34852]NNT70924.1 DUF3883 domain-containing protein [Flavobacterium sp. IMCC34852]
MLKDLRKYNNLGTPSYYYYLLDTIKKSNNFDWKINDIRQLTYNKMFDNRSIFDGCIPLALHIEILILKNDFVSVNDKILDSLNSHKQMIDKFNEFLFLTLKNDEELFNIFNSEHLNYDIIYKSLQISNSAFGFKFSSFKQLLLDFEIIQRHPTLELNTYIVNNRYKKLFDKTVLPEIRKRKIGVDALEKQMQQQQIYGEEAELYVLNFEKKRLNNKEVNWIAEYVANEGYDIASFNNHYDTEYNRFIEVKSYQGKTPYFYWSRNEFQVAKYKHENYWIYLVNRDSINDKNYIPVMIQNPFTNILDSDKWTKETDKLKITANFNI